MPSSLRYSSTTNTIHAAHDTSRDAWCGAQVGPYAGGSALWVGKFCKRCGILPDIAIVRAVAQAFLVWHHDDEADRARAAATLLASVGR